MKFHYSLAKISFFNILFTALIFSITISLFTIKFTNDSYTSRVKKLEQDYIEQNKELITFEVKKIISVLRSIEESSYQEVREDLQEKVNYIITLLQKEIAKGHTPDSIVERNRNNLDLFKWDNYSGYFYIFDASGRTYYHGADKAYEKQNLLEIINDNQKFRDFFNQTVEQDLNFGSYPWYKPTEMNNKLYEKYVFAKKIKKANLYVAAGVYKKEVKNKVQDLFLNLLEERRFGENDYGYFWAADMKNILLMHPIQKHLVGKAQTDLKTLDGQYLFKNIEKIISSKGSGFIQYVWNRPDNNKPDEKISYVFHIKDLNLFVASGFYLTQLTELLDSERVLLKKTLTSNLVKILFVISILVLISVLLAWWVSIKISRVEKAQKEHKNMLEQYKLVLDKSALVSKTDSTGLITYVNDSFLQTCGFSKNEVLGNTYRVIAHPETPVTQSKNLWDTITKGQIWTGMIRNKKKNGDSYYNNTTIVPIKDSDGKILEYISASADVTELVENRSKLQKIFTTDSLTGLGNRIGLISDISRNHDGTLALIDINRFKEINEIQGHDIGDTIIKELGTRIFDSIADESCLIYRVQADVFALYSLNKTPSQIKHKIEKFINTQGKRPYVISGSQLLLSYTSGIASQTENLLTYADMALVEAKRTKKGLKIYEESMNNIEEYKNNILWVEKIHSALNEDRVIPFYQPIFNYHSEKIDKYECLMRIMDNNEIISPMAFLSIAKKTNLYPKLTLKMIAKAISEFAGTNLEFSINLCIEDLMNQEVMNYLYDQAEKEVVFKQMVIEIVESEEIKDSDSIAKKINQLKEQGVKIAIDDFGSGYSNYDYLISLQPDYIKIDGSIIKHLKDDQRTQEVVRSIVNFADNSNMKIIAEFVGSKEIDDIVRSLGVDYAQGYLYGKPEPKPKTLVKVFDAQRTDAVEKSEEYIE